jgi:membrane-bound lytic murein transglycosylase F
MGLAQFLPSTWADVTRQLGWSGISANQAGPAIDAGAYYMARLRHAWLANRPMVERHYLALSSYNSGLGNILKAQSLCHNALLWLDISPCLPQVTGALAKQTVDYVVKIRQWRMELE